jgi:hypothetical protein
LTKLLYPSGSLSVRKKLQLALWSPPSEGNIFGCFETDLTNVFKYLKSENARFWIKDFILFTIKIKNKKR